MTRCLTKSIRCTQDHQGFTLVELMMAIAFSTLLMIGVYGFYSVASQSYSSGVTGQTLQDAANIVISKIIEGETESSNVYRLSTSTAYMIPNGSANEKYSCGGSPQTTSCNSSNTSGEVYFCQDTPCTGASDPTARWYYLNNTGTSIIYHHFTSTGSPFEENIYTAPVGSTLILRFSPAAVTTPANVVEIDVALTQNLEGNITNQRLVTSGAASTFVLLRDHP